MPTPTATIFLPYHALDDVILRGTRAAQPAASAVVAGTLYGVTDEGNLVERSTGAVWQAYSPAGGGVALLNAANVFTAAPQTITTAAQPRLTLSETAQAANLKTFRIVNGAQVLRLQATDDAGAVLTTPLGLDRAGNATVGADLYEKGRATPLGHWQTGDCSSYNSAGLSGPIRWSLVGKTMVLLFAADGVIGSGLASIALTIPGGYSSLLVFVGAGLMVSTPAKTWHTGVVATGGGFTLDLYDELLGVWPAGHVYINGSLTLAVP